MLTVARVTSPTNLTTIGTRLTEHLATWAEDEPDRQSVFCFESVTALCQYTTLDQTCRFLDAATEKVADYDAVGHYHLDPSAVDRQTVERLTTVFDHWWEFTDGTWDERNWDAATPRRTRAREDDSRVVKAADRRMRRFCRDPETIGRSTNESRFSPVRLDYH
jgi:hypothetical protein